MNRAMKLAFNLACKSPAETYRHAAIIFKKGRMITGAFNMPFKTHTHGSGPLTTCHAELRAIAKARAILNRNDLSDCVIYVLRINRRGEIKLSKPCKDCATWIGKYGLTPMWSTGVEDAISNEIR